MADIKKVVVAYSGGLDTSIILSWIKETYNAEVIAWCVNVGQDKEVVGLKEKAKRTGASKCYVIDAKKEFVTDYIFPAIKANALYENRYLLGRFRSKLYVFNDNKIIVKNFEGNLDVCEVD